MVPDYVNFNGWFNPQKPLSVSQPDFMREIGFASTGGYPIEQAPWMAGPPVPDFMTLGGMDSGLGGGCCGWDIIGMKRNPKTGFYALTNYGLASTGLGEAKPIGFTGASGIFALTNLPARGAYGLNGYYSIPQTGMSLGSVAAVPVELKKAESKEAYDFSQRVANVISKASAGTLIRYGRMGRDRLSKMPQWADRQRGYYNWYYPWKMNMDLYTDGINQLDEKFGPFSLDQINNAQGGLAPPKKGLLDKAIDKVANLAADEKSRAAYEQEEQARQQAEQKFKSDERARIQGETTALILEAEKSIKSNPEIAIVNYTKVLSYNLDALNDDGQVKRIAQQGLNTAKAAGQAASAALIKSSQAADKAQAQQIQKAFELSKQSAGGNHKMMIAASVVGVGALATTAVIFLRKKKR